MEEITLIDPRTDSRWSDFISRDPRGYLCYEPGWKDVLEDCFPHMHGYYATLIRDDRIYAALPVYEVRSWLTGNRLVSIPFATLCDPPVSDSHSMVTLFDYARDLADSLGVEKIRINTYDTTSLVDHSSYGRCCHYKLHVLRLDRDTGRVMKTFDRTCVVQKIRRAEKSGLEVRPAQSGEDVRSFYDLYAGTRKNVGVPPQPFEFFRKLFSVFSHNQRVRILLSVRENVPLAGVMLFTSRRYMSAEYLGYDSRFIQMNPHHILFWEAIQMACAEGFEYFDFGRTSVGNAGLMRFKKHWGTEARDLPQWVYPPEVAEVTLPVENSLKYRAVRELCRRSPRFMLKPLSKFSYRHLG